VDLNLEGLDPAVRERLRERAETAGLSLQQYLWGELTRIASRWSPDELAGSEPTSRAEFESIRRRLRDIDAAKRRL